MGFFSWKTQDTNESIPNIHSIMPSFEVHMINPLTGEVFTEKAYDGYGVFGGKDFYELLAEMNGLESEREEGIDLAYSGKEFISPILVRYKEKWEQYKDKEPESCRTQGYFYYPEEDEEEY